MIIITLHEEEKKSQFVLSTVIDEQLRASNVCTNDR